LTRNQKLIALLSYLPIVFFVPLLYFRKDQFIQYHAKQGIILFMLAILMTFSFWISALAWILWLVYIVIWVTGVINVITGKIEPVPVVGKIAERINL
jgi:fumarate reductase subunit D